MARLVTVVVVVGHWLEMRPVFLLELVGQSLLSELMSLQLVPLLNFKPSLYTLLYTRVVRQHSSFGVFDSDAPLIEDLLFVHSVDCLICRLPCRKHDVAEALGNMRIIVADQVYVLYGTIAAELFPNHVLCGPLGQAGDVDIAVVSKADAPVVFVVVV